mgnify:CR=1 FL=1
MIRVKTLLNCALVVCVLAVAGGCGSGDSGDSTKESNTPPSTNTLSPKDAPPATGGGASNAAPQMPPKGPDGGPL